MDGSKKSPCLSKHTEELRFALLAIYKSNPKPIHLLYEIKINAEADLDISGAAWALLFIVRYEYYYKDKNGAYENYINLMYFFEFLEDRRGVVLSLIFICEQEQEDGKESKFAYLLNDCHLEIQQDSDPLYRYMGLRIMCKIATQRGDVAQALYSAFRALREAKLISIPEFIVGGLHCLGTCLRDVGKSVMARDFFIEALELSENHPGDNFHKISLINLAECLIQEGCGNKAQDIILPYYDRLSGMESGEIRQWVCLLFGLASTSLGEKERAKQAFYLAERELGFNKIADIKYWIARSRVGLMIGEVQVAIDCISCAANLVVDIGKNGYNLAAQVYSMQTELFFQNDQFIQAKDSYQKYMVAFERLHLLRIDSLIESAELRLRHLSMVEEHARDLLVTAQRDGLTGLMNRDAICNAGNELIQAGRKPVVVMIRINRFTSINNVLGPDVGDRVLINFANQLSNKFTYPMGHLHAAQFCILCHDLDLSSTIKLKLEEIEAAGFELESEKFDLSLAVGISFLDENNMDMQSLMRNAEIAMRSDMQTHQGWTTYHASMGHVKKNELSLQSALRRAVDKGELCLFLQPKINLLDGSVGSVEALLRWHPPNGPMVPPITFIPFAEQTGVITQLTCWVMKEAMRLSKDFNANGLAIQISINISTQDLNELHFLEKVEQELQCTGANPDDIRFEITESGMMHDPEAAIALLDGLRRLGISISIDDFGTGHSSLAYLRRMAVAELKIDRAFVHGLDKDPKAVKLLKATIDLGHSLNLSVVAEGAETKEEWQLIRHLGCDYGQGWFSAKPMCLADFLTWWEEYHSVMRSSLH